MNKKQRAADRSRLIALVPDNAWEITEPQWQNFLELGVKSIRLEFILKYAGGSLDNLDFTAYDKVIDRANELGIEVMMLAAYASYPSKSHRIEVPWGFQHKYDNHMELVDAMRKIVPHFRDKGVHAWEIWNEENGLWHLEPDEYAELLTTVYECFHYTEKWDTDAVIVYGGLDAVNAPPNPMGVNGGTADWFRRSYLSEAFKSFRAKYGHPPLDAVSAHPYHVVKITDSGEEEFNYVIDSLKGLITDTMDEAGDTDIPIWITEIGNHDKNEMKQAKILEAFYNAAVSWPRVTRLYWFKYQYSAKDGNNQGTSGYGIIYSDTDKKQSYYSLKRIADEYNSR